MISLYKLTDFSLKIRFSVVWSKTLTFSSSRAVKQVQVIIYCISDFVK